MFAVRELYCVVCGATFTEPDILDLDTYDPDDDAQLLFPDFTYDLHRLKPSEVQWLSEFRVFGTSRQPESTATNESPDGDVFISSLADWNYSVDFMPKVSCEKGLERQAVYSFFSEDCDFALFPIHDGCMNLLQRFINTQASPSEDRWLSLFDFAKVFVANLRYCERQATELPKLIQGYFSSRGLEWEHGYFGARPYWSDPWDAEPGREWLVAEPVPEHTLGLDEFLLDCFAYGTSEKLFMNRLDQGNGEGGVSPRFQSREIEARVDGSSESCALSHNFEGPATELAEPTCNEPRDALPTSYPRCRVLAYPLPQSPR